MKFIPTVFLCFYFLQILFCDLCVADNFDTPFGRVPTVAKKEEEVIRRASTAANDNEALKILENARSEDWFGAGALFNLGNLYYRGGAYSDAVRAYNSALKKLPSFFMAQKNLAFALEALGDGEGAFAEFVKALALSGGSDVDILMRLASRSASAGDFSSALASCNQALVYSPNSKNIKFDKALFLHRLGLNDEAEKNCLELLERDFSDRETLKLLSRIRAAKGDSRGAILPLEILKALKKCDADTSDFLAALYYREKLYSLSAETFGGKRAVDCSYAALRSGDLSSAVKIADTLDGEYDGIKIRGLVQCAKGDFKSACKTFSSAASKTKSDAEYLFFYARALAEEGNDGEALKMYGEASKTDSYRKASLYGMLSVYARKGDIFNSLKTARLIQSYYPSGDMASYIKNLEECNDEK